MVRLYSTSADRRRTTYHVLTTQEQYLVPYHYHLYASRSLNILNDAVDVGSCGFIGVWDYSGAVTRSFRSDFGSLHCILRMDAKFAARFALSTRSRGDWSLPWGKLGSSGARQPTPLYQSQQHYSRFMFMFMVGI